ncbi:MAG: hypothetical protein FWE35_09930 [Streptosporangiales bacterium]|nr:hypothetical protein [Streptosporangiales bacterium]
MVTTRRPRGREIARPNIGGPAAEHKKLIGTCVAVGLVLLIALLMLTGIGHTIDLAVQHFMLFYAGVFALIGLCTSVGAGLAATDRMFLHPGQRVMMQSIHRAASFGAFAFLVIHVVTEILAQRIDVIDAFIPFLQPFKTFYVGLGTIAGDIMILLVITGIMRKRFVANGKGTWRWRAIHYSNYVMFVFGVWHGLLGGRPGKPYVDWSYGFVVAFVALFVALRVLANSLRPKESLSAPAVSESATSGTAPLRAAMLAQASTVRAPGAAAMTSAGGTANMLPSGGTGPVPVMQSLSAAPGYGEAQAGPGYGDTTVQEMPVYEPGYEGPPRYQGAPRPAISGPMPAAPSGPMPAVPSSPISGPLPQVPQRPQGGGYYSGPPSGPMPQAPGAPSGAHGRPAPVPGPPSGGFRRPASGPMPRVPGAPSGAYGRPAPARASGPPTGGFSGPPSGPMRRAPSGPMPQAPGAPSGAYGRPAAPAVPAGYAEAGYPAPGHDGTGYDGMGYDGMGYEQAPRRRQGPRQAYRGGDQPR